MNEILQAALAVAGLATGAIGIGHAKSKAQSVLVHHATHGDLLPGKVLNRIAGELVGLLTLNTDLGTYRKGRDGKTGHLGHHGRRFATHEDEESQFMLKAGYQPGMTREQLWQHHRQLMRSPKWHLQAAVSRLRANLLGGPIWRRVTAWGFWGSAIGLAGATGMMLPVAIGWLLPLFVLGQAASWTEAVSRHRWLATSENPKRRHAELSHGRYLGAMPPPRGSSVMAWLGFCKRSAAALLGRILVVPADLAHHQFHHLGLDKSVVTGMVSWTDSAQAHSPMLWLMPQHEFKVYATLAEPTEAWFAGMALAAKAPAVAVTPADGDDLESRQRGLPL